MLTSPPWSHLGTACHYPPSENALSHACAYCSLYNA